MCNLCPEKGTTCAHVRVTSTKIVSIHQNLTDLAKAGGGGGSPSLCGILLEVILPHAIFRLEGRTLAVLTCVALHYSKLGPWVSSISVTWELVRDSHAPVAAGPSESRI